MTDRYAVFGNPVAHSKSPLIHSLFAKQKKQDMAYDKQLVELSQFAQAAKKFFAEGGKGLNITVPFKLDAYTFADELSPRAKLAGAVNTLKKNPDGKIFGDNTDGVGMVRDITKNLGWEIKGKNILILGAGGAVRGVMGPLLEQQPKSITIANRTRNKAEAIIDVFKSSTISLDVWDTSDTINLPPGHQYDLIINGTSAGLLDNDENWFSSIWLGLTTKLSTDCCGYDMMYGKSDSDFLGAIRFREKRGADGLGMLVEQAAESFFLWRGVRPETAPVIKEVRQQL